jgi:hypothetical protein
MLVPRREPITDAIIHFGGNSQGTWLWHLLCPLDLDVRRTAKLPSEVPKLSNIRPARDWAPSTTQLIYSPWAKFCGRGNEPGGKEEIGFLERTKPKPVVGPWIIAETSF